MTDNGSGYRSDRARPRLPRARPPPPAHPALPATHQRQSRTLHPHHARRLGLRRDLRHLSRTNPRPTRLARSLQSPPTTPQPQQPATPHPPHADEEQRSWVLASTRNRYDLGAARARHGRPVPIVRVAGRSDDLDLPLVVLTIRSRPRPEHASVRSSHALVTSGTPLGGDDGRHPRPRIRSLDVRSPCLRRHVPDRPLVQPHARQPAPAAAPAARVCRISPIASFANAQRIMIGDRTRIGDHVSPVGRRARGSHRRGQRLPARARRVPDRFRLLARPGLVHQVAGDARAGHRDRQRRLDRCERDHHGRRRDRRRRRGRRRLGRAALDSGGRDRRRQPGPRGLRRD